jgi:hypothetical protein
VSCDSGLATKEAGILLLCNEWQILSLLTEDSPRKRWFRYQAAKKDDNFHYEHLAGKVYSALFSVLNDKKTLFFLESRMMYSGIAWPTRE